MGLLVVDADRASDPSVMRGAVVVVLLTAVSGVIGAPSYVVVERPFLWSRHAQASSPAVIDLRDRVPRHRQVNAVRKATSPP